MWVGPWQKLYILYPQGPNQLLRLSGPMSLLRLSYSAARPAEAARLVRNQTISTNACLQSSVEECKRVVCTLEIQRVQLRPGAHCQVPCESISGGRRICAGSQKMDVQGEGEDWSASKETAARLPSFPFLSHSGYKPFGWCHAHPGSIFCLQ